MIQEADKHQYRQRLSNPNLSYMTRKAIRKKIVDKCKKVNKCPHCKEHNGVVKKMTASKGGTGNTILKIVHERNRGRDKSILFEEQLKEFNNAIESNPDIKTALTGNPIPEILTPVDVLKLFERIPESDIILLAMDQKKYFAQ